MGIERFFNSLAKNENIVENGIMLGFKHKINATHVYIDFNSIIYNVVTEVEKDLNYLLYSIIDKNIDAKCYETFKIWNTSDKIIQTVTDFKQYFTSELIDNVVIEKIKNHIIYITTHLLVPDDICVLYIALDGVPQMNKIIEQKKRRYNGYLLSKLKDKIYKLHSEELPEKRKEYESNKVSFDRNKITTWTKFMTNIMNTLLSENFKNTVKHNHPKLKEIIVNHQLNYGEGEKKIMEHIIENKQSGKYIFYSPDADAIILSIIGQYLLNLNDKSNESQFTVLRFNQQSEEYDYVDINILCNNMFNYMSNTCEQLSNIANMSLDIAFIFTLFGNDFIPKLESIDVRNDIELIMKVYCTVISKAKKKYLIFKDGNSFKINYINFFDIIQEIANIENMLLLDTFMANKYKNYNFYKRELDVERLYPALVEYIEFANSVFDNVRNLNTDKLDDFFNEKHLKLIKMYLIIENNYKKNQLVSLSTSEIINIFKNIIEKNVTGILDNSSYKNKIGGKLKFQYYDTSNVNNDFHLKNIKENFAHPNIEITEYDKEVYKLEKRMGQYETMLNAVDYDLGNINMTILPNGNYKFVPHNTLNNVINYYETFFSISLKKNAIKIGGNIKNILTTTNESMSSDVDTSADNKMKSLVDNYIKGLFWVFDSYFNKNNSKYNVDHISTWFYPYHRSPLLFQVRDVLYSYKKNGISEFINKINQLYIDATSNTKFIVNKNNYMNNLEHYIYVTPVNKQNDVPNVYKTITNDKNLFPDLGEIVDQIWNGQGLNVIECKRIPYLNKCNLLTVPFVSFSEYMKLMIPLRLTSNNEVSNTHYDSSYKIKLHDNHKKKPHDGLLKSYKHYFKKIYFETRIPIYKKYYKKIKYFKQQN